MGGPGKKLPLSEYSLVKAEATDTRLMGVMGLHLHWALSEEKQLQYAAELKDTAAEFHQLFYFECEENNLETSGEVYGDDTEEVEMAVKRYFGGLGASMHEISAPECMYLAETFIQKELFEKGRLSSDLEELHSYALGIEPLNKAQKAELMKKICVGVITNYGRINYFLMRSFARDVEGARLLASDDMTDSQLLAAALAEASTLRYNSCRRWGCLEDDVLTAVYLCESLVETDLKCAMIFTEIAVREGRIVSVLRRSGFYITDDEADRKLSRPEFISFYEIGEASQPDLEQALEYAYPQATRKIFDNGLLFMEYNEDNSHVELPEYRITDDLKVSYFITNNGQLIVAGNDMDKSAAADAALLRQSFAKDLMPMGRYSFAHPLLGPFIDSGYDDFIDYLREILK